ncbi:hypothetical protein ACU8OR_08860 [Rhizobium leguminosarum]
MKPKSKKPKFNTEQARVKKRRKIEPKAPGDFREENYRILNSGLRAKTKKKRILIDLTADLSKYEDTREPAMPGKTIRNEFRKYPWKNSSYDTVKG